MRSTIRMAGALLATAVLVMPAAAQGMGDGPRMGRGMGMAGQAAMARNPAAEVLKHRAALELTAAQVEKLERIRDRVEAENGPRHEQLRAAFGAATPRDMSVEERQALRARMQELAPVRLEMRATNRAAGEEIHELLTAEQEERLRPLMHADRPRGGDRPMQGRRGPRGPRGGG